MENESKKLEVYAGPADGRVMNIPNEMAEIGTYVILPCQICPSRSIEYHEYQVCRVDSPRQYSRLEHRGEIDKAELDDFD